MRMPATRGSEESRKRRAHPRQKHSPTTLGSRVADLRHELIENRHLTKTLNTSIRGNRVARDSLKCGALLPVQCGMAVAIFVNGRACINSIAPATMEHMQARKESMAMCPMMKPVGGMKH